MNNKNNPVKLDKIDTTISNEVEVYCTIVVDNNAKLVDNWQAPTVTVDLESESIINSFMDNIPERLLVGGRYLWIEDVVVKGFILSDDNRIFMKVFEIRFMSNGKIITFQNN